MKSILLFAILFFVLIPIVLSSEPSLTYVKQYLNPFYRASMTKDTNYTYSFYVNPPSELSEIKSAIISFEIYIQPSVTFYAYVNGTPCSTPQYSISTTYASAGLGKINFDCSNVIKNKGYYVFTIRPTQSNAGSSTAWLDLTYQTNPLTFENLKVYGTEYAGGDYGKVWLQLLDSNKQYISNATCLVSIYYPDNTILVGDAYMFYLDKGIYYYNLEIPKYSGVYPVVAECFYITSENSYMASSGAINMGSNVAGDYTRTWYDDGSRWEVQESNGRIDIGLNFTNLTQPFGFNNIAFIWNGEWKNEKGDLANDYITFYVYNFTSGTWLPLPNIVNYQGGEQTITNTIHTTNLTASGLASGGVMRIRMVDRDLVDTKATKLKTDYFSVKLIGLTRGEYQEVKGSSEIHVSEGNGYYIQTLCGNTDSKYNCGIFTNDDEFEELEGEIEDNITVYSISQTQLNTYFTYETPNTIDCSAIYWVKHLDNGNWTDITDNVIFHSSVEKENCIIEIPLIVEPYGIEYYKIKMDNYLKWEVLWTNDLINSMRKEIEERCYSINSTHNYSVPITETTYLGEGDTRFCHRTLDDLWWWDYYYNASEDVNVVGDYISYLVEARFYRRAIYDELLKLREINITIPSLNITYNATFNNTFNITIDTTFMNESISSLNQSIISLNQSFVDYLSNLPYLIWNYMNRTLTEFNFEVNISNYSLYKILYPIETISLSVNKTYEDLKLLNSSIFTQFQEFDQYIISINDTLKETNSSLSYQISNLHSEILELQSEISNTNSNITQLNSSLMSKLYKIQDEITSVNDTIKSLNITLPQSISTSIWEYPFRNLSYYPPTITPSEIWEYENRTLTDYSFLDELKSQLLSINDTIKDTNSTLYSEIQLTYSMVNETLEELKSHNNTLLLVNSSLSLGLETLNSKLNSINSSLSNQISNFKMETLNKLNSIEENLTSIYSFLNLTNSSTFEELQTIKDYLQAQNETILSINSTIMSKLYKIQDEITSVNDTIKDTNSSLSYQLSLINDELVNMTLGIDYLNSSCSILNETLSIMSSQIISGIEEVNSTLLLVNSSIISSLENISSLVLDLNSSMDFNSSLIDETYLNTIQLINDISNHNNKLISINETIMGKLYRIQDEIVSVNDTMKMNFDEIGMKVWNYYNRTLSNFTINGSTIENLNALATFRELKYAGGTEYSSGETGTIAFQFISIQSGTPIPINTAECNVTIWFPNKTEILLSSSMSYLTDSEGLYYKDFIVPSLEGVYTSEAVCHNSTDNLYGYGSSSFHVGNWTNKLYLIPNETSESIKDFIITYNAEFEPTNYVCISNSTMRVFSSNNITYSNKTYSITKYIDYECPNGCELGKCKVGMSLNLWLFIIAISIGLFLSFLVKNNIVRMMGSLMLILLGIFTIIYGISMPNTKASLAGTNFSMVINNQLTLGIGLSLLGLGMVMIWASLTRKQ